MVGIRWPVAPAIQLFIKGWHIDLLGDEVLSLVEPPSDFLLISLVQSTTQNYASERFKVASVTVHVVKGLHQAASLKPLCSGNSPACQLAG